MKRITKFNILKELSWRTTNLSSQNQSLNVHLTSRGNGRSPDVYEGQPLQTPLYRLWSETVSLETNSLFIGPCWTVCGLLLTSLASFRFSQMYSLSSRSAGSSAKVFLVNGIPGWTNRNTSWRWTNRYFNSPPTRCNSFFRNSILFPLLLVYIR